MHLYSSHSEMEKYHLFCRLPTSCASCDSFVIFGQCQDCKWMRFLLGDRGCGRCCGQGRDCRCCLWGWNSRGWWGLLRWTRRQAEGPLRQPLAHLLSQQEVRVIWISVVQYFLLRAACWGIRFFWYLGGRKNFYVAVKRGWIRLIRQV